MIAVYDDLNDDRNDDDITIIMALRTVILKMKGMMI